MQWQLTDNNMLGHISACLTLKLFTSLHILITIMVRNKNAILLYFLSRFTWLSMDKLWNVLENNVSNDFISKYVSDFSCWESYPVNS